MSRPGRSGKAWRRARAEVLKGATQCQMPDCRYPGVPLDFTAPKLSPLYPTVDHLIKVSDTVGWSDQERESVLNDPRYLRPAHASCNASRNQNRVRRTRRVRPSRDWGV
jgi:hypothetical protein